MNAHTRSYVLGGLLMAAAFVTRFTNVEMIPAKGSLGSWTLLIGGSILVLFGWWEQNKAHKKKRRRYR